MNDDIPRFYGTWKGRVIEGIVLANARDWNSLLEYTGLGPRELNIALRELYEVGVLKKLDSDRYWVSRDLYDEYLSFFEPEGIHEIDYDNPFVSSNNEIVATDHLIRAIIDYLRLNGSDIIIQILNKNGHVFVKKNVLLGLIGTLMHNSQKELIIVNPFVDHRVNISADLMDSLDKHRKREVFLITKSPEEDKNERLIFHKKLKNKGVKIFYNKEVHAKLVIGDSQVAIVSSMNFTTYSMAMSWEAGIISVSKDVVSQIREEVLTSFIKKR